MIKTIKDIKGYMIVEVIVASVISLIMAYFLMNITIKLVNKNNDYYVDSIFLANKNIVTKEIMDDINSKKLAGVEVLNENQVKLTYIDNETNNSITKKLKVEGSTITYGDYAKKLSEELNISGIVISNDTTNKILTIKIPAYTNYSKEDYGIKITTYYNSKIQITYPMSLENGDKSGANEPSLGDGLIPVYYNTDLNKWLTADYLNRKAQWYDYDNKKWANAVLVTNQKRATLAVDANGNYIPNQEIGDTEAEGVLAFYVWIPRYKYKLFNANKTRGIDSYNALTTGIDIVFETGKDSTGEVSCTIAISGKETCTNAANGKYYTHPAFTFGSEELTGFWMGKFELTGSVTKPTIMPSSKPINAVNRSILDFYNIVQTFTVGNNIYGLSKLEFNSHIIKNMEWGAVAYLTNSKYGRCTNNVCEEVMLNNSYAQVTGNAADSGNSSSTSGITNAYDTIKGGLASTTGNIYGVYDMNGGAWEFAMGNMIYSDGKTMTSGYNDDESSGFNGILSESGTLKTDGVDLDSKYYDRYEYGTDFYDNSRGHLGDASVELVTTKSSSVEVGTRYYHGWYNDYILFADSDNPWFIRSGNGDQGINAGIFYIEEYEGGTIYNEQKDNVSTRSILTHN